MTLSELTEDGRERLEAGDRYIVPFWNWSSISVTAAETDRRLVLNETGPGPSDVDCSDYITVP